MINEIEAIVTPDGNELVFGDPQMRVVTKIGGRGAPPVEYQTVRGYNQQSETVLSWLIQPRTISMTFTWNSTTRAQYWAARRQLIDSMRVNLGGALVLKHTRGDGTVRCIQAYPDSSPIFDNDLVEWDSWEETLSFICYDPMFYNAIPVTKVYPAALKGSLTFPIRYPLHFGDTSALAAETIAYAGTWATWPLVTINGPYTSLSLMNQTTNKQVVLGQPIEQGEQRVIDLTPGAARIVDGSGANCFNELILPDSDLMGFNLRPSGVSLGDDNPYGGVPGGNNTIRIVAEDNVIGQTAATMTYYERFVSID